MCFQTGFFLECPPPPPNDNDGDSGDDEAVGAVDVGGVVEDMDVDLVGVTV
jgi:hypothetical protein